MVNNKDNKYYIKRLINNIEMTIKYVNGYSISDLKSKDILIDAIENRFVKMSEDIAHISKEIKEKYADCHWNELTSIRNRIGHAYDTVDLSIIYNVVKSELPLLLTKLQKIVDNI